MPKNVDENNMQECGGKVIYEIHPDTPPLKPINMGTSSFSKYEILETLKIKKESFTSRISLFY